VYLLELKAGVHSVLFLRFFVVLVGGTHIYLLYSPYLLVEQNQIMYLMSTVINRCTLIPHKKKLALCLCAVVACLIALTGVVNKIGIYWKLVFSDTHVLHHAVLQSGLFTH